MSNKMISFPYEIKITHFDFGYYSIYYSSKDRQSGSLFLFCYIISIIMALRRMV